MDGGGEIVNVKRWTVFHPVYINSKKTVAEGRRISLGNACENPTCAEVADCCAHLKLPFAIEVRAFYFFFFFFFNFFEYC
jgi:signal recognition particle subunit SRP19